jgi:hypothetical protein
MEATGNDAHQNALSTCTEVKVPTSNKILIYKAILKPTWTHGIQLWGTASSSNIEIIEHFRSKLLRMIVDEPWQVPNMVTRWDLQTPKVTEEFRHYSSQCTLKQHCSEPHGATRQCQAIVKTPAK